MITIYKASAGSGKTFTLALRYISLLIGWHESVTGRWRLNSPAAPPPARHRAILAVTFTNKATAEMKTRIVETLAALSHPSCPPDNPYMEKLLGIIAPATVSGISFAARRALMQLLFDFGSFNVSTIDSFFQTVLRTFARELNLPDNYRIQLNQQEAIENAVRDMLDVINSNSPYFPDVADADSVGRKERLREWILAFMESRMSDGKAFNLFNRSTSTFAGITRQLSLLFNETYKLHAPKIDAWLDADSGTRVIKLREALGRRIGQLRHDIIARTDALLTYVSSFGDKVINRNLASAVKCWTKGEPAKTDSKTMIAVAAGDPDACVAAAYKKDTALSGRILEAFTRNLHDQKQLASLSFLIRHLYPLGLFGEMRRHLDKFCREENMVLQSNTNDFLSRIISTEKEAPFIYERLGLRLQHFLLDEFQDTSAMQWRILRPLILESLSNGKDNLIIGDGKQSIYGFRNTDYRLLNHIVAKEVGERHYPIDDRGSGPGENVNYRSSHTIVRFNNALFDAIPAVYDLTPADSGVSVYAGTVQELADKTATEPGYVDIAILDFDQSAADSSGEDDAPGFKELGLSRLLQGVVRQLRAGYRPKDIAVLVRKRSEGEEVVKHLLSAMDTPGWEGLPRVQVMSSDAILVGESPLVKMIVARMRMLLMPDATPPAEAEPSTRRAVTHRDITRFVSRFHMHLFVSGEDAAGALGKAVGECSPRLAQELPYDAASDDRLLYAPAAGLVTLAERIVREAVAADAGSATAEAGMHSIYISAFMDMVSDYASHYGNDLRGFLEWWDANRGAKSLSVPDDVDAINVLTIHKAKGLEFPCVHVPFLSFRMTETSTAFKPSYRWYPAGDIPGIDPELVPPYIPLENKTDLELMPESIAREFREFIRSQYLDNINLLYVALTRPTRELVVTAQLGKDEKTETVGDALLKGIKAAVSDTALKLPLASLLTPGATLIIGELTSRAASSATSKSATMPDYVVRDNDSLLKITRTADRYIHDFADPVLRYRFLKRVLAETRSAASLPVVLRRQAHKSRLDSESAARLLDAIRNAIDHTPEAPGWFDGYTRLLLSPEIFVGNVPDIKRWRPDRIVWRADGYVDVVEYCTSALDDQQIANLCSKVRSVMRRLAAMGHTGIRGFLWNIDTPAALRLTLPSNT